MTNFLPLVGPYTPSHGRKAIVGHRPVCRCDGAVEHDDRWDAYFCVASGVWLDPPCGCDKRDCPFAGPRPLRRESPAPPPAKLARPARAARSR